MVLTSDIIVVCILISISGIGFIFNTSFLIFSFVNRQVTSKLDYRWFLYNLAVINFFYTLNMFIFQPYITLKDMDPKGDWCFITGFLVMMCAVGGVISQPLLSINRYFAMFYPEKSKKFFKKPYCICMVIGIYVLSFLSAYSFVPFDEYGRFEEHKAFNLSTLFSLQKYEI
uniref:G-protein coupled receptors family 1 profile domain-containing protein n=1 Tax=Romanomermis culicivorax TaxID=13658 RepID=A0A915JCB1_ROMCU